MEAVEASLRQLTGQIADLASSAGLSVPAEGARMPHMFGTAVPGDHINNLVERFAACGVIVSRRGASLRFSPHLHVTEADLGRLKLALR